MRFTFLLIFLLAAANIFAQETAILKGKIFNEVGEPLELANVYDFNSGLGDQSLSDGSFQLEITANEVHKVRFSYTGYKEFSKEFFLKPNETLEIEIVLESTRATFETLTITDRRRKDIVGLETIDSKIVFTIPGADEGIEKLIKILPGVASNNDLSSQYSVRGGNFDENLVYVNGFEIIRPFLVRSGQQEGLSFINPEMVRSVDFSAGGFEAKYGDKLSSVLDVTYKRPTKFKGSAKAGLLGYSGHVEGTALENRFTYQIGLRYKTNQYVLNALPTKGLYRPRFLDLQAYLTYAISEELELSWIGNISNNLYSLVPESSESTFGLVNQALNLRIFFEGQEQDRFNSSMNGIALNYRPNNKFSLKFLNSIYFTNEREAFDIIGQYWIGEVESDPSKDEFGDVRRILGVGTFHNFARNQLQAQIFNSQLKGNYEINKNHFLQFGLGFKNEDIVDKLNEWERQDSAGYSRPIDDDIVNLESVLKSEANLNSNRFTGYIQDNWEIKENKLDLSYGLRFQYWDLNKEFFVSPRINFAFSPTLKSKKEEKMVDGELIEVEKTRSILWRLAIGSYNQPGFLRELRNFEGEINTNLLSQKSIHFVLGMDYDFLINGKPFKFSSEAYFKPMWDLVPYDINNVLIRYYGENLAKGYATGIDFRLNGNFVGDTESWFTLSFLNTREDIENDFYINESNDTINGEPTIVRDTVEVGWLPRPTDQLMNMNILFQDYMPNNENLKVHLNLALGTRLPFGPPDNAQFRNFSRMPLYRRVDIGFSAMFFDTRVKELKSKNPFKKMESLWATVEIFNLMGFTNTISYLWVEDFRGTQYAAPNFLANRLINARLIARF